MLDFITLLREVMDVDELPHPAAGSCAALQLGPARLSRVHEELPRVWYSVTWIYEWRLVE